MEYKEKLTTKEWIDRRREILVRDLFTCQKCGHRSQRNHVHHVVYIFGREPWNYPDEYLLTLCYNCHYQEHKDEKQLGEIINNMKLSGLFCNEIKSIICK